MIPFISAATVTGYVECTARFSLLDGMEITCIINNDFTGNGITSIRYNINNLGVEEGREVTLLVTLCCFL